MTAFGPTFEAEMIAAGLGGKPLVVHRGDGVVTGAENLSEEDAATLAAVIAAHDPEKVVVPQTVTPRQARLALLAAGKLEDAQTAVNAADEATRIAWEYATEINRHDALIVSIGAALGLTAGDIDALFVQAATL